jgi:hypothetical protein
MPGMDALSVTSLVAPSGSRGCAGASLALSRASHSSQVLQSVKEGANLLDDDNKIKSRK